MMSAKFWDFLPPPALVSILNQSIELKSRNLPYCVRIWVTPSLPLSADVICEWPQSQFDIELYLNRHLEILTFSSFVVEGATPIWKLKKFKNIFNPCFLSLSPMIADKLETAARRRRSRINSLSFMTRELDFSRLGDEMKPFQWGCAKLELVKLGPTGIAYSCCNHQCNEKIHV